MILLQIRETIFIEGILSTENGSRTITIQYSVVKRSGTSGNVAIRVERKSEGRALLFTAWIQDNWKF